MSSMYAQLLSHTPTPGTIAHQAPLVHETFQTRVLKWITIFLTWGLNPHLLCLLPWQVDSYH